MLLQAQEEEAEAGVTGLEPGEDGAVAGGDVVVDQAIEQNGQALVLALEQEALALPGAGPAGG
jgi:hypothetical protein